MRRLREVCIVRSCFMMVMRRGMLCWKFEIFEWIEGKD